MTEHEPKGGWPCDRREAHGPHPVPCVEVGFDVCDDLLCEEEHPCPGVQAHPNTTIGGAHDGQPAMYGQIDVGSLMGAGKILAVTTDSTGVPIPGTTIRGVPGDKSQYRNNGWLWNGYHWVPDPLR